MLFSFPANIADIRSTWWWSLVCAIFA